MQRLHEPLIRQQCLIGGEWVGEPSSPVVNPASGETIARVPNLGAAETRRAIGAARRRSPPGAVFSPRNVPQFSGAGSS